MGWIINVWRIGLSEHTKEEKKRKRERERKQTGFISRTQEGIKLQVNDI